MTDQAAFPVLSHLRERLVAAQINLEDMRVVDRGRLRESHDARLKGKAQGVGLALSYVDEYLRDPALGQDTTEAVSS